MTLRATVPVEQRRPRVPRSRKTNRGALTCRLKAFVRPGTGLATSSVEENTVVNVAIDGIVQEAQPDELLLDLINHFLLQQRRQRNLPA
jgi:hypothetical protein